MSATVLFAGGGTGGHVFPLIALAEAFGRLAPQLDVRFVGSANGIEARVVPARGWPLDTLPAEPLKGRSAFGVLRGSAIAMAATAVATKLIAQHRPRLIVSVGGYAAGPISLAGATLGVPIALLEPNLTTGLTQRLLTPIARRVYVGFVESLQGLGAKGRALGVPLRTGFVPTSCHERGERDAVRVLVIGGSQGAEHLNSTLPSAIARLAKTQRLTVLHQAGPGRGAEVTKRYARAFDAEAARALDKDASEDDLERARRKGPATIPVEVVDFLDDVASKLADADLVVSRSGAGSCAEICAVGRAAILVPYPHAADDHQAANAEALVRAGAAIAMRQDVATVEAIADAVRALAEDGPRRRAMGDAARARGIPDASERIARDLLELIGVAPRSSDPTRPARGEVR